MGTIASAVTETPKGVVIRVIVTAGSKHPALFNSYDSWRKALHCSLRAPATEGRANRELVERFSIFFGVAPTSIHIIEGLTSTNKKVLLAGTTSDGVISLLQKRLGKPGRERSKGP